MTALCCLDWKLAEGGGTKGVGIMFNPVQTAVHAKRQVSTRLCILAGRPPQR
jgi:hypothetical protein